MILISSIAFFLLRLPSQKAPPPLSNEPSLPGGRLKIKSGIEEKIRHSIDSTRSRPSTVSTDSRLIRPVQCQFPLHMGPVGRPIEVQMGHKSVLP